MLDRHSMAAITLMALVNSGQSELEMPA